ncbi:rho GTPase-activating protein 39 isoform X2 [Alligator mississippiensis]|uniref:rho GTPase-activating protein 39 isoform X2 n=1 Tax=Alligator mississippiensis TaxID=8496 RepID=UPI002877EF8D|nr:rho GTPase-activating protein 39 isoform X2 [Alligator mississippiensis]
MTPRPRSAVVPASGALSNLSDWVEIIEPRSHERMYVNLTTGECGWEPPPNLKVRQSDQKQWWELFDQSNNRFYYYNAITQQTVWHRPQDCDIVPLAQLQAMKQNSQSDSREHQHRVTLSSDGRNTHIQMPLLQEMDRVKDSSTKKRPDSGRETTAHWQPLPGTKSATLVKVSSLKQVQASSNNSFQAQNTPETRSQKSLLTKPVTHAQTQFTAQNPAAVKPTSLAERKRSIQIKKTENGGFCLVLTNGPTSQSPPVGQTGTPELLSPKFSSPAPIYDEPSLDSSIYDEPPVDMGTENANVDGMSSQMSQSSSLKKHLLPIKLLQHPGIPQHQAVNKQVKNLSTSEYSPAGREYIKYMVNIDQSSKHSHPLCGEADGSTKLQFCQLTSKDSFKQSWRILEANVLRNIEAHHSWQNNLQTHLTVISQQDSGYSTGPSPSLRKRKEKSQLAGQRRPGSLGSIRELSVLNDKLIAEMRAVVGRSAACRGSKASLDAEVMENTLSAESSQVRFQSDQLKKGVIQNSRDNITSSNRSLGRQGMESKGSFPNDPAMQQDTVRQKRTYEKMDSLEKTVTSQTSLVSSNTTGTSSQPETIESNSKQENSRQPDSCMGYQFPCIALPEPIPQSSMVDWASKNLNMHTQGIFRRRISISNMLSWSGDSIKKPMLITSNRTIKKEACEMFKLVQIYMGDRQTHMDHNHVALVTITKCWSIQGLRDELYIQLIRQTTDNTCYQSLARGWELMAISLAFFSPSPKFQSYLEGYIYCHLDSDQYIVQRIKKLLDLKNKKNSKSRKKRKQNTNDEGLPISTYARYCYRKLQKVAVTGGKKGLQKPTIEEIAHARNTIVTPSLFGSSLEEIMLLQKEIYPGNKLPWIQTQLSQQVLALGGEQTEGIFRVPGDIDEVNALKLQVDQWSIPSNCSDPSIPASLLKLWYRELEEPLIPQRFYEECIGSYENPDAAVTVVQFLPDLNKFVLYYLIHFLQIFAQPYNVGKTKMDVNNLAMVMAPNCLRCQSDDPRVIFENTRKEMSFLRMLIVHLDTSFIEGMV